MGQAVPEIPLSVGSKLEVELLLRAFVFAKFPYTSLYTHAFVRVCIILPHVYTCILLDNVHIIVHRRGFCTLVYNYGM